MKEKMLWNKEHTASVRASKIREITISPEIRNFVRTGTHVEVRGWFDRNENFVFAWFNTKEEAITFVKAIHSIIEN